MLVNAIEWSNDELIIIDQTRLPGNLEKIRLSTLEDIEDAIRQLKVRGAPAIGIAAAYGTYVALRNISAISLDIFREKSLDIISRLNSTRPTAVNLSWALNQMANIVESGNDPEAP